MKDDNILSGLFASIGTELCCAGTHDCVGWRDVGCLASRVR